MPRISVFARFCDPAGQIWNLIEQTDTPKARELVIREANHCPAGRLVAHDKKTGNEIEHKLAPSIGLVEDPALGCSGPLWVRGGIRIESHDCKPYEVRNRVTLCRCGASSNMPFCNGSHASIKLRRSACAMKIIDPIENIRQRSNFLWSDNQEKIHSSVCLFIADNWLP